MTEAVIVALITSGLGFLGVIVANLLSNKSLKDDIKEIKEDSKEQSLSILRLTVMNNEMPISERLIAGKKYIDRQGNGDVKHYYEQLVKEHTK